MEEVIQFMFQLAVACALLYVLVISFKYSKTEIIIDEEYEKDGHVFHIISKYYRRFHMSRKRRHVYSTVITSDRVLPNIFLDSHFEDRYMYATEYDIYDQSQRMSLEGDFNKYFQVYAPKGLENDALILLSPDVMLIIRDQLRKTDVLFLGGTISLTTNTKIQKEELISGIYKLLDKVSRAYKYVSADEQIRFSKVLTKKNSVDEAVKFRSRLVSAKTIAYWVLLLMFVVPYIIIFFLIERDSFPAIEFLKGLFATLGAGITAVVILHANDKGWIKLDRTKK